MRHSTEFSKSERVAGRLLLAADLRTAENWLTAQLVENGATVFNERERQQIADCVNDALGCDEHDMPAERKDLYRELARECGLVERHELVHAS